LLGIIFSFVLDSCNRIFVALKFFNYHFRLAKLLEEIMGEKENKVGLTPKKNTRGSGSRPTLFFLPTLLFFQRY
jgi:hypothetical protein